MAQEDNKKTAADGTILQFGRSINDIAQGNDLPKEYIPNLSDKSPGTIAYLQETINNANGKKKTEFKYAVSSLTNEDIIILDTFNGKDLNLENIKTLSTTLAEQLFKTHFQKINLSGLLVKKDIHQIVSLIIEFEDKGGEVILPDSVLTMVETAKSVRKILGTSSTAAAVASVAPVSAPTSTAAITSKKYHRKPQTPKKAIVPEPPVYDSTPSSLYPPKRTKEKRPILDDGNIDKHQAPRAYPILPSELYTPYNLDDKIRRAKQGLQAETRTVSAPASEPIKSPTPETDPNKPSFPPSYTVEKIPADALLIEDGVVSVGDKKYPVHDGYVITAIEGQVITNCSNIYFQDGKIYGKVKLENGRWLPVNGDKLVTAIEGQAIMDCMDISFNEGKLYGRVELEDGRWLPVNGDKLVTAIEGQAITNCSNIYFQEGKLYGAVNLEDGRWLPVNGDKLVTAIEGQAITNCMNIYFQEGKLYGRVNLEDGRTINIQDYDLAAQTAQPSPAESPAAPAKPAPEIDPNKPNFPPSYTVEKIPEGALNGGYFVKIGDKRYPTHDGYMVTAINGHKIIVCNDFTRFDEDNNFSGSVLLEDRRWLPVYKSQLIEKINGKNIECNNCNFADGILFGSVTFSDGTNINLGFHYDQESPLVIENGNLIIAKKASEDETKTRPSNPFDSPTPEIDLNKPSFPPSYTVEKIPEGAEVRRDLFDWHSLVEVGDKKYPVYDGYMITAIEGHAIKRCYYISFKDGKLYGAVNLEDGRLLPVNGDKLVTEIEGQAIMNCEDISFNEGKLYGKVKLENGRWLPVNGDKLVTAIEGQAITNCMNIYFQEGKLYGRVNLEDGRTINIQDYDLAAQTAQPSPAESPAAPAKPAPETEPNKPNFPSSFTVEKVPADALLIEDGVVSVGDKKYPVHDGYVITAIEGQAIMDCMDISFNEGKLYGRVELEDGRWLPVNGDKLVTEIEGHAIKRCYYISFKDGKLYGAVKLENGRWLQVNGDKLVTAIEGQAITNCSNIYFQDGKLYGRVKLEDGRWLPVNGDKLVTEIEGQAIMNCVNIYFQEGKLYGRVNLEDGRTINIQDYDLDAQPAQPSPAESPSTSAKSAPEIDLNKPSFPPSYTVEKIPEGAEVRRDLFNWHSFVEVGDKKYPVYDGYMVTAIEGQAIMDVGYIDFREGKLYGEVKLENGRWLPVNGDKLVTAIEGQAIEDVGYIDFREGKPYGEVKLEDGNIVNLQDYYLDAQPAQPSPAESPSTPAAPTPAPASPETLAPTTIEKITSFIRRKITKKVVGIILTAATTTGTGYNYRAPIKNAAIEAYDSILSSDGAPEEVKQNLEVGAQEAQEKPTTPAPAGLEVKSGQKIKLTQKSFPELNRQGYMDENGYVLDNKGTVEIINGARYFIPN